MTHGTAVAVAADGTLVIHNEPAWRRHGPRTVQLATSLWFTLNGMLHCIPVGFVSDGGSIPRLWWWLVGHPFAPDAVLAFFVHDYLHRQKHLANVTSKRAHWVLYVTLRALHVGLLRRSLMYSAVAVFGGRWQLAPLPSTNHGP